MFRRGALLQIREEKWEKKRARVDVTGDGGGGGGHGGESDSKIDSYESQSSVRHLARPHVNTRTLELGPEGLKNRRTDRSGLLLIHIHPHQSISTYHAIKQKFKER